MFLRKIMGRMSEVSLKGIKSPDDELEEGDRVVGVLSDDIKRLHFVMGSSIDRNIEMCKSLQKEFDGLEESEISEERLTQARQECLFAHLECDFLKSAFWTCVKFEFPELVGVRGVAIRKDWQVVVTMDPSAKFGKALSEFLSSMSL